MLTNKILEKDKILRFNGVRFINVKSYYGKTKLLHSQDAEEGARQLIEKINNSSFKMDILPNQCERFTEDLEENDYISYGRFLSSVNGQKLLKMLEE